MIYFCRKYIYIIVQQIGIEGYLKELKYTLKNLKAISIPIVTVSALIMYSEVLIADVG